MSKLFKKTLLIVISLFVVISVAMSALSGWNIYRSVSKEFTVKGQSVAGIIADAGIQPLLAENPVRLQSMIDNYLQIDGVSYIAVANQHSKIVAHTFVPAVPKSVRDIITNSTTVQNGAGEAGATPRVLQSAGQINIIAPILGGVAGTVIVGMDMGVIRTQIWSIILQQQGLMLLLLLVSVGICYFLINRISQPLLQLSDHAKNLAGTDIEKIGSLHTAIESVASHSHDEIGALARSFVYMEEALSESVRKLAESVAEQQRISAELAVAQKIQMHMLPDVARLDGLHESTRIEALIRPAKEMGGDLFDCFFLGHANVEDSQSSNQKQGQQKGRERLFFLIGDVSGKGVPAALFMSMTCALIRAKAAHHDRPSEVLEAVNSELSSDNDDCMFVTVFCGVLDLHSRQLVYCSAGHNAPYLVSAENGVRALECEQGIALGAMDEARFSDSTTSFGAGEMLFMFTDGVTEAINAKGQLYAEERLVSVLSRHAGAAPSEVLHGTLRDLQRFSLDQPQADDITMMAIQCSQGPVSGQ